MQNPRSTNKAWIEIWLVIVCTLAMITCPNRIFSQIGGGGSIQGSVVDQTGAVVPNATVTAINVATGSHFVRNTSDRGVFVVTPLNPGTYMLQVNAPGFAPFTQEKIAVDAMQIATVNVSLTVGSTSITITVAPPPVNSSNDVVGDVVRNDDYSELPLNMNGGPRCSTCLINYSAGEGNGYNGGTQYHNEIYVDGMIGTTINMQGNGNEIGNLPVEAVEQGEVQTVGISAQFQGQGVASFTTRSGGNAYHGALFEFFRNTSLDTWNFASKGQINSITGKAIKPVEHQNEFGGDIGGPIIHDKMFFFAALERMIYMQTPNPSLATIPTSPMQAGDFSQYSTSTGLNIYDPASTTCVNGTCTRSQFVYNGVANVIPPGKISPVSKYLQQWLPTVSNSQITNNYYSGYKSGYNFFKSFGKLDYNLTPSQRVSMMYTTGNRAPNPTDGSGLPIPYVSTTATTTFTQLASITHTWTINARTVNDFKYGYARYETCGLDPSEGTDKWSAKTAGLNNYGTGHAEDAFPNISFSGTNSPTGWDTSNKPTCTDANTYNIQNGLQTTRGTHSLNIGGQFEWYQYNATSGPVTGTNASWTFYNTQTESFKSKSSTPDTSTGSSYASYLLGSVGSYYNSSQNGLGVLGGRFKSFSPYLQDDWKINTKLTVNLGIRWDIYTPWKEAESRGSYFDANALNPITGTSGTLGFYGDGADSCHCSRLVGTYLGNFGPRIGFAYTLNPKTVIHASYGLSYTHGGGTGGRGGANNGTGNNGLASTRTISSLDGYSPADPQNGTSTKNTWDTAIADLPGKTISASWGTGYTTTSGYTGSGQAMIYADPILSNRSPVYANWNFGVQRALTNTTTVTIDYAASMGNFLPGKQNRPFLSQQINPAYLALGSLLSAKATSANIASANQIMPVNLPFTNFSPSATIAQMLLPYPQFAGITDMWGNRAHSRYNALEIALKQTAYKGLTLTANYTFSKLMDNENSSATAYDSSTLWQMNTESPSKLNIYGTWKEPYGHGSNRLVNSLIQRWIISGIFTYSGGGPLSWSATGCTAPSTGSCLPNLVSGNSASTARINGKWGKGLTGSNIGAISYLNTSAFSVPSSFTLGSVFRNAYKINGPHSDDIDLSIKRKFPIYHKYSFQFEASAFNLTNHVEFGGLNTQVGSKSFGQFSKQSNASRDIQLSGRIEF